MVVAAKPQRIGGARGREDLETVGDQVLTEQFEGGLVVLADDDGRDLFSWSQHARPKGWASRVSPPFPRLSERSRAEDAGKTRRDASGGELAHGDGAAVGDEASRRDGAAELEDLVA